MEIQLRRIALRGRVFVWGNIYFSRDLLRLDRQEVQVFVNKRNPRFAVIRTVNGELICRAEIQQ